MPERKFDCEKDEEVEFSDQHSDSAACVMAMDDSSQDLGQKLFIGGLSWQSTNDTMRFYFQKYGEVIDCVVMRNSQTGNSRGFGFVTFKDPNCVDTVLASKPHALDGKVVDCKVCNPKAAAMMKGKPKEAFKVFVGGLPPGAADEEIKGFFTNRYGTVREFQMMYDQLRQRSRGFGFLTFESEDCANQAIQEHFVDFKGKKVEIKRLETNKGTSKNHRNGHNDGWNMGWHPPHNNWNGPPAWGPGYGPPHGPPGWGPGWNGWNGPGYQGWGAPPMNWGQPPPGPQNQAGNPPQQQQWGPPPPQQPPADSQYSQQQPYNSQWNQSNSTNQWSGYNNSSSTPAATPAVGNSYQQQESSYGPTKGYAAGNNYGATNSTPSDTMPAYGNSNSSYSRPSATASSTMQQSGYQGGYHPYRR